MLIIITLAIVEYGIYHIGTDAMTNKLFKIVQIVEKKDMMSGSIRIHFMLKLLEVGLFW